MRLDAAVADTSALLSLVGVLPLEPLDVEAIYAPDVALVEVIAVLRSFHEGRLTRTSTAISPPSGQWSPSGSTRTSSQERSPNWRWLIRMSWSVTSLPSLRPR